MKSYFSLIISSKDEGEFLKKTIDGLLQDETYKFREIIVVDDGSTDGSLEFFKSPCYRQKKIKLVRGKRLGIARSRNLGAKYTKGNILVFIDAHMKFTHGWLRKINSTLKEEINILGIDCKNYNPAKIKSDRDYYYLYLNRDLSLVGTIFKKQTKKENTMVRVPFINGNCLIVKKDVFEKVGGFLDVLYGWGLEDKLFCLQAYFYGYDSIVNPSVNVFHLKKNSLVNQKMKFAIYNSLVGAYLFYPNELFIKTRQLLRKKSKKMVFALNENLFLKNINKIKKLKREINQKSIRSYQDFVRDFYQHINY